MDSSTQEAGMRALLSIPNAIVGWVLNPRVLLTVVTMVLAIAGGAFAKVIHVDDDAPPGGDGSSWTTAYTFLQDALAEAETTAEPVEIRIAQPRTANAMKPALAIGVIKLTVVVRIVPQVVGLLMNLPREFVQILYARHTILVKISGNGWRIGGGQ